MIDAAMIDVDKWVGSARVPGAVILASVPSLPVPCSLPLGYGYNAATGKFEDLVAAGIIDPVKVVRLALENSAELAGLLLTSAAMIVDIPEPPKETYAPR
jgi:chaperonin GroEL